MGLIWFCAIFLQIPATVNYIHPRTHLPMSVWGWKLCAGPAALTMLLTRWLPAGVELIPWFIHRLWQCGPGTDLLGHRTQSPALPATLPLKGNTSARSCCMVCSSCCESLPVFSREIRVCASAVFVPRVS